MPINFNNANQSLSAIVFNAISLTNVRFQNIECFKGISSISIKTVPAKTSYYQDDELDTTGLKLTVTYNNGTSEEVDTGFTCDPMTLSTVGNNQAITVTYGNKTTSFTVNVAADNISSIQVISNPTNTEYTIPYGSSSVSLNTAGLKLKATYDSGKTKTDITSGFTCSPTTFSAYNPTQTVTVTYGGKTATFTVKVDKEVSYTFPNADTSVSSLNFLGFAISAVEHDSGSLHLLINNSSQDGYNVQIKANHELKDGHYGGYVVVKFPSVWGFVNLQSVTIYGASNFGRAIMSYSRDRDQTITNTYQQTLEGTIFSGKTPANINTTYTVNKDVALIKIAFTRSSPSSGNIVIGSEYKFNVVITQSKLVLWGQDPNYK